MNMGTGAGAGGGRGGRGGGRGANQPATDNLPGNVATANAQPATPATPAPPAQAEPAPPALATIGPDGPTGNVLYAWDPIARKERWRAAGGGAGAFAGGALATAGNLVFSSVNNKLLAFRADTGEKVYEIDLGTTQMGPPISFTIDGTQYIAVTAGLAAAPGAARGTPPRAPQLFVLGLDGKAPLPGAQN
jgi:quinohemoprotein ethanol dehydrogenase